MALFGYPDVITMPADKDLVRSIFLVGAHCVPTSTKFALPGEFDWWLVEEVLPDRRVIRVQSRIRRSSQPIPLFWKDKVVSIHVWERARLFDHRIIFSCIHLTTTWLDQEVPRYQYAGHLNALFASILGDCQDYVENPSRGLENLTTPSILYVQSDHCDDLRSDVFTAAMRRVGIDPYFETTTARVAGTWFFPGLFGFGTHEWKAVAALDNTPDPQEPHIMSLPALVCDLAYLQALTLVLGRMLAKSEEMPFLGTTAQRYVRGFLAGDKWRGILQTYQSSFLADKELNVEIRLSLEREAHTLDEQIGENLFYGWRDRTLDGLPVEDAMRWPGKITHQVSYAYNSRRSALRHRLEISRTQEDAVSELLRDRAVAASAQTNLRLQVVLFVLTLVSTVPLIEKYWPNAVVLVHQLWTGLAAQRPF